ncbi:hypothetical protein OVW24_23210, partial [Klebsiella pneumoniae]|nr:hypothetical protein [Klebsiella pneumoniae]
RKRAYCLKIQPATGSFARNLIYSTKPSASRGKAEIALFDAVFIVPLSAPIAKEDVLIVNGKKMRVESIHQRWGLRGRPGHYEVGANIWV